MLLTFSQTLLVFSSVCWLCISHLGELQRNSALAGTEQVGLKLVKIWEKWASTRENLSSGGCKQHRRRPACASTQPGQHLCYSFFGKCHMLTCYRWNFNFPFSLCCWEDWFETCYVKTPQRQGFLRNSLPNLAHFSLFLAEGELLMYCNIYPTKKKCIQYNS